MKKRILVFFLIFATAIGVIPVFTGCAQAELMYGLSSDGDHYYVYASGTNLTQEQFDNMSSEYGGFVDPDTGEEVPLLPVTAIANTGFLGCSKLKDVVIPEFITTIGSSAFAYCKGLRSFRFSGGIETIPYGIFGGCSSLKYVDIPANVKNIAYGAFYASYLKEIVVPETVTYMGDDVFYRCLYLVKAEIYASIDALPYGTFCSCQSLTEVWLSDSIKEIKGYDLINGDGEIITEDDVITGTYDVDTEDPNYTDNVVEKLPAFYFTYLDAGSDNITFDYEIEDFYYCGTEAELNEVVVGEYNVCLTESSRLTVHCLENGSWIEVEWKF